MRKTAAKNQLQELGFDEALLRLEALVDEMERGELTLEDALGKHAAGTELARLCLQQLQVAEKAVDKVLKESDGVLSEIVLTLPEAE